MDLMADSITLRPFGNFFEFHLFLIAIPLDQVWPQGLPTSNPKAA